MRYICYKEKGVVTVNDETGGSCLWGSIPIRAGEIHSFENNSNEPFEMIIYGIALERENSM